MIDVPTNRALDKKTNADTRLKESEVLISQALIRFCEDYVWQHGFTKKTADNYRWATTSFIKAITDKPLSTITLTDIHIWRKYMECHHYETNAINSYLYKIRNMFRYFNKHYELGLNPEEITIPKMKKTIPKYLTKEQVYLLLKNCDRREKAILSVLYSSGIRVGELVQLRKKDVYGDALKIRGKGNCERLAFIDEQAIDALQLYLLTRTDTSPFLFYSLRGKGLGKTQVQNIVKNAGKRVGLEVTPHCLRHSFATHMAQAGCGVYHLQRMLGHADVSTTQIYVHLSGLDVKNAYQKFHKAISLDR